MINSGLGVTLVATATLCTIAFIGLGFLARPSRQSAVWASAFAIAMISSYAWAFGNTLDSPLARAASSGLLLGANTFVWVGLRLRRGAERTLWTVGIAYTVVATLLLAVTVSTDAYAVVFRVVFASAAVFSVLIILELLRLGASLRDEALPLGIASAGFVLFAVVSIIDGFVRTGQSLELVRELNAMGSIIYLFCTLLTLLFITRQTGTAAAAARETPFHTVAADRLARAADAGDEWWSVLDIRLDDPADLRAATSPAAFDRVAARFCADVRAVLPSTSDIEERSDTNVVALVPLAPGELRQVLSRLLERIATVDPDQPISVRLSASVGWVQVSDLGYNLDELIGAAHAAATRAQRAGGDRWNRHAVDA